MTGTGGFRSLADQLRAWPDTRLADLLTARPDLASPAPHDTGQLASRAGARASVTRAIDQLEVGEIAVLDAIVVAGHTTTEGLVAMVNADSSYVVSALSRLQDLALVWDSSEGIRAVSVVADCLVAGRDAGVSGLRPVGVHPRDTDEIATALSALGDPARALLTHVVDEGGRADAGAARVGVHPEDAATPAEELLAQRLLVPVGDGLLVVPGEVGRALRGGRTTIAPVDASPQIAWSDQHERLVASVAVGSATEFVQHVEQLLVWWGDRPAAALRTGGLGVRELKAAAEHLGVDQPTAALVVETASAAGLLAGRADADGAPVWVPTDAFDTWAALDTAERWTALASAWLDSPRLPSLVGERGPDGKAWNALTPELAATTMPETKRMVLTEMVAAPPGSALAPGTGLSSLIARLTWLRPRRPRTRADLVAWVVAEAARLGITGLDAAAPYARALLDGDDPAAELASHLPPPVDHVLIQADLTAVAPGPLRVDLARSFRVVADVESRGTATVYRFTTSSIRRALDLGWSVGQVHDFVGSTSRTPVPQPLTYLIDDTARSFGRLRVGVASSFIRSDDEAALVEVLRHPRAEALGLRRLAPTVLTSDVPVDVLLPRLRELGLAPVVEATDGTVHVHAGEPMRARSPRASRARNGAEHAHEAARVATAVRALRAGDAAAAERPATSSSPGTALSALRDAIERRASVTIAYTDNRGVVGERLVRPVRVEGGQLTAIDPTDEEERRLPIHRITRVTPGP